MEVRKKSDDAEAVIGFLQVLLRKISGNIFIIWDGSPLHRNNKNKAFLKAGTTRRLHLEQLSGFAPELNPDEGIWQCLRRVEMGNLCCTDLDHLYQEGIRAKECKRHKREIIRSCSQPCCYLV